MYLDRQSWLVHELSSFHSHTHACNRNQQESRRFRRELFAADDSSPLDKDARQAQYQWQKAWREEEQEVRRFMRLVLCVFVSLCEYVCVCASFLRVCVCLCCSGGDYASPNDL